jgi:stage IV sporulation protein FB
VIREIRYKLAALGSLQGGRPFTLFGFAVRIHPTFWLVALVLGLHRRLPPADLLTWVVVVLLSILVHELGHAFMAARWSVVYRITIHGAGGETVWRPLGKAVWWQSVVVTLAGPVAGFSLAYASWLLLPYAWGHRLLTSAMWDLLEVNVAWGVFNLLPIAPLDGGQALRTWLVEFWYDRGEWIAAAIGCATAVTGLMAAIVTGQAWAAVVLALFGIQNGQVFKKHWDDYRETHRHTKWQKLSGRDLERERY